MKSIASTYAAPESFTAQSPHSRATPHTATSNYNFPENTTLLSLTDTRSFVTYANAAFLEVSGYTRDALLGQPHNLVRHPDMPREAFADLWQTIRRGETWTALVKNQRANGSQHYWVRANVTPVRQGNTVIGYMSVRTKPDEHEIAATERLYQRFREGQAHGLAFHQGLIVKTGWRAWTRLGQTLPIRWRFYLALGATALAGSATTLLESPAWLAATSITATAVLACAWLHKTVAGPLQHILTQAKAVASGQPGVNLQLNRVDELGMTLRAINQAGLNLRALLGDVAVQIQGMEQSNQNLAQGNRELEDRVVQTQEQIQATTATAEQIAHTVEHGAEAATTAHRLALEAETAVSHGGQAISKVVETMRSLSEANSRIAEVNSLVDNLAFQTNLLALNAAVEAARAGAAGSGFAVVAAEVRMLAQRSAEAAQAIRQLISTSTNASTIGAQQAEFAGVAMHQIVDKVRQVGQLVAEISSSAKEQSLGVAQVSKAVATIDVMTQENARLAASSSSLMHDMLTRTHRLAEAISVFEQWTLMPLSYGNPQHTRPTLRSVPGHLPPKKVA